MTTSDDTTQGTFLLLRERFTPDTTVGQRADRARGGRTERLLVVLFDILVSAAFLVGALVVPPGPAPQALPVPLLVLAFASLMCIWLLGLQRVPITAAALDDVPRLAVCVAIPTLLVTPVAVVVGVSERSILTGAIALFVLLTLGRIVAYAFVRAMRSRGLISHRTVFVGAGSELRHLYESCRDTASLGMHPVAVAGDAELAEDGLELLPDGSAELLAAQIDAVGADRVIVGFGAGGLGRIVDALRVLGNSPCEVYAVPRMYEVVAPTRRGDHAHGMPLQRVTAIAKTRGLRLKRAVDVLVAGCALVILSPVMAIVAAITRLVDGPGVIFRQTRVGRNGAPIEVLKFRSLRPQSESEAQTRWSVDADERIGRWGRFLRRTSLDELPQLWNVVRGDMSLVGPRPERPHFVDMFSAMVPHYRWRHRGAVGLTGLAQVRGLRGDTSIADRARADNFYLEHRSLWLDFTILVNTVLAVVRPVRPPQRQVDL